MTIRRLILRAVLAAAMLAANPAQAADWRLLGESGPAGNTITTLVDVSSIKHREDLLTAWEKKLYAVPQKNSSNGRLFRSDLELWAFDCKDERVAIISFTDYEGEDIGGAAVSSVEMPLSQLVWSFVSPGSVFEGGLKLVCGIAGRKEKPPG